MGRHRFLTAVVCTVALAAPAAASTTRTSQTPAQIRAYHDSGAYAKALAKGFANATKYVAGQLKKHPRKPAVVLDIDETSLSNYGCLDAKDFDLSGLVDCAINSKSTAIPPARTFYRTMRTRHVSVFFITGAPQAICDARKANLASQGFGGTLDVTCRPPDDHADTVVPYKSGVRKSIAARGFTILANVGDQRSDLAGGAARKTFKLANPIYLIT